MVLLFQLVCGPNSDVDFAQLGGIVGAAMGGIGNAVIAREEALLEAEQAGQHLKTMPGFIQYRSNVHRNVTRAAVRSGAKVRTIWGAICSQR